MNKNYKTEQENFWATNFGDNYIQRNNHTSIISTKCSIFTDVLRRTRDVKTILELGSNIGLNLRAIKLLKNDCELSAVEINPNAAKELKKWGGVKEVFNKSILDFQTDKKWDLIIISGVLIHINPEFLNQVYDLMSKISIKYVLISEYYNPTPVELDYRGHKGKLFKRDFAGEMLDRHNNFSLLDYGFVYHRDNNFPLDDGTWFLLEKDNYKKPIMPFLKEISGKFENGNIIVYDSEISLATHHVAQGGVALIKDLVPESYLKEVIDYNSTFVQSFENSKCNDSYCNWARLDFENEKSETMRCFRISHFGDVEGYSNIIPSNIKNLFNQLLKLQNNISGNNFSFFSQNKDFFVTPQILHYPANGGYLDTHSHPFLPQKIGIILCLKSSDIGGGSTYFETSNGRFDTGNYHKAGDLLMFKYDQPHGVTSVGSRGEVDWSLDSGRISLIFPVKSCS